MGIPKKVFIIPYRDRKEQMYFFQHYMNVILVNDMKDCEIYFSHQYDNRPFNRGAVKNIGFLAIKSKYPNDYKDMDFIFNDVDTIPYRKIFSYETTQGIVSHYYGSETSLGGIVVIKGIDFELINGFPCLWSWGLEDSVLYERCLLNGLKIDRSTFYPIGSPEILQLFDGMNRLINKSECERGSNNPTDGISTIKHLYYSIDKKSKNVKDVSFLDEQENLFFINIFRFATNITHKKDDYAVYDVREPIDTFFNKSYKNSMTTDYLNNDWKINQNHIQPSSPLPPPIPQQQQPIPSQRPPIQQPIPQQRPPIPQQRRPVPQQTNKKIITTRVNVTDKYPQSRTGLIFI